MRQQQATTPQAFLVRRHQGLLILSLCLALLWVTGCGSSGSSGANNNPNPPPPPPPPQVGTASGRLIVPPNSTVEVEPNHTLGQAQPVTATFRVSGQAAVADPGFTLPEFPAIEVEDLYRLNTTDRVRITLNIAADNLATNDLDLFLLDSAGNVLDASEGLIATEVLETPAGGGTFIVGIRAFAGASAYIVAFDALGGLSGAPTVARVSDIPPDARFVPGDILLKVAAQKVGDPQHMARLAATYTLTPVQVLPGAVALMRVALPAHALQQGVAGAKLGLPGSAENALKALTIETIRRLHQDPDVIYAEANFLRQASLVPNDEFYPLQWHYELINLPEAWNITTGSDAVIVAVIDTGVLSNHPDFSARLVAGFDFISSAANANDGDGLDADPSDPGDDVQQQSSSFHGTHVTGTIGAVTNNNAGVAGVTWQTQLMPLRVLGVQGGTDADIAQAIRFAAGLSNSSGRFPAAPARIINMSLGGPGFSQTLQDAVQAARAAGVIIVAAAGNENTSALQAPASLEGVISVAAVDMNAAKTPYSNFGAGIDVAAPGGDLSVDVNGDSFADGVLSTLGNDRGQFTFRFYQGTSMAAPHVAGVLALMLAVNPDLTPADIDQLLAGTHPETSRRITRDLGASGRDDFFGQGLIDAATAVIAAGAVSGGAGEVPVGSILRLATSTLNFDNFLDTLTFALTNAGSDTLTISSITTPVPWLTLTPNAGTTPLRVRATVDRRTLAAGVYSTTIQITSDATQGSPTASIAVSLRVGGSTLGNVGSVFVLVVDSATLDTVAQATTTFGQGYAFTIPSVPPGSYFVIAGTDRDGNFIICEEEDACGSFPDPVTIVAGQEATALEFVVGDLISLQGGALATAGESRVGFARLR